MDALSAIHRDFLIFRDIRRATHAHYHATIDYCFIRWRQAKTPFGCWFSSVDNEGRLPMAITSPFYQPAEYADIQDSLKVSRCHYTALRSGEHYFSLISEQFSTLMRLIIEDGDDDSACFSRRLKARHASRHKNNLSPYKMGYWIALAITSFHRS